MQGLRLSEVQEFGLELLMFAENITKLDEVAAPARKYFEDHPDELRKMNMVADDIVGAEDLSGVQWQSPSDSEEVMDDIALFNQAMADNANMVIDGDEGGEWL